MEHSNVDTMVAKLRAVGVDLWVEDGRIRGRMRADGKPPYAVGVMMAELRDLGMVAVGFLQRAERPAQPAGSNEVHQLKGMNATEASSLIEFIREGRGELIGQFIYHKSTGLFEARVRFLEGWDS